MQCCYCVYLRRPSLLHVRTPRCVASRPPLVSACVCSSARRGELEWGLRWKVWWGRDRDGRRGGYERVEGGEGGIHTPVYIPRVSGAHGPSSREEGRDTRRAGEDGKTGGGRRRNKTEIRPRHRARFRRLHAERLARGIRSSTGSLCLCGFFCSSFLSTPTPAPAPTSPQTLAHTAFDTSTPISALPCPPPSRTPDAFFVVLGWGAFETSRRRRLYMGEAPCARYRGEGAEGGGGTV
ncbi:hypothetical protein B0H11DRAFT_2077608 [Mycena galericulata]|nr:hypothetical protein B0H11DRAFT_2077608 [Mycena galericulata]